MSATTESTTGDTPIFSERLTSVLATIFEGKAPNVGRFCGNCYTPIDAQRTRCPHCDQDVAQRPPVEKVPAEVLAMFRQLRRRESLVVNGFAYVGLFSGVATFIGVFYVLFTVGASVWWYVFDIALLFVLSRVLAGLLGGYIGDEVGYRFARRKLAEEWAVYAAQRDAEVT